VHVPAALAEGAAANANKKMQAKTATEERHRAFGNGFVAQASMRLLLASNFHGTSIGKDRS